ncbi:YIP1 family protein [Paenibacillus rhizovicinus]|uniref:YIP1 family protein n=1 Tax=Paenibacillus rhizovicinus TaxID=2704463 RepID=A0A6C0NY98_9BACL|nr:Yip1 family protein [Paenibacillus rhizovicinus]QHW31111.1 YIP1 family protein [Paenibacillus rhizovicinus]
MVKEQLGFAFYVIFHPFKGFWDMKYEGQGRTSAALSVLALLVIAVIVKMQFAGFLVNGNKLDELNSMDQLRNVVLPFFLWCVANWSTTTLMEGEGKFVEIIRAVGYALLPMALLYFVQTAFSNIVTLQESAFYYFFDGLAVAWIVWLLFIGTMTVHQYSVSKTIVTMGLSLIVCGIIIFIGMLFFNLLQQMFGFVYTIYRELAFRS